MMGQDDEIRAGAISGARARQRRNWTQIAAAELICTQAATQVSGVNAALAARLAAAHAPGVLSEDQMRSIGAGMRDRPAA
jgi:hypothetical protein